MMDSHQLIHQDSGNTEYWTPVHVLDAARYVLGDIDFDPSSCEGANQRVKATRYFSTPAFEVVTTWGELEVRQYAPSDAFVNDWCGRTWMNHPFAPVEGVCKPGCTKKTCLKRKWHTLTPIPSNGQWISRYVQQYQAGNISAGLNVCIAATSERWLRPLMRSPQCYFSPRLNYDTPDGKVYKGFTKGSVVTYLGDDVGRFVEAFEQFGEIKVSWSWLRKLGKL